MRDRLEKLDMSPSLARGNDVCPGETETALLTEVVDRNQKLCDGLAPNMPLERA